MMKTDLPRRCLITGISGGLGAAMAERAFARGWQVFGTSRSQSVVDKFIADGGELASGGACDVTDPTSTDRIASQATKAMGGIDLVINNAGYCLAGPFETLTPEQVQDEISVNLIGTLNTCRSVLPHLREAGFGHILNISSLSGVISFPGMTLYTASKFAVTGFSEALAKELSPHGIHVTAVAPGGLRTRFAGESLVMGKRDVAPYRNMVSAMKERFAVSDGNQPNDPYKAAEAILSVAGMEKPPLNAAIGVDAFDRVDSALEERQADFASFRPYGENTGV